jgi:bifunctional non-homologous end joining protein LigD
MRKIPCARVADCEQRAFAYAILRSMAWKSKSRPARRRNFPNGFVSPAIPVVRPKPPTGAEWLHELKFDGYRICARRDGSAVHLWSRNAAEYAGTMTRIVAGLRKLRVKSCTVDGEAVILRPDGTCDFFALRGKDGQASAVLVAFDIIELNGQDLRRLPIEDRRAKLAHLLRASPKGVLFSSSIGGDGEAVFCYACALGGEGIVSKRAGSTYVSGRCPGWRKTLCSECQRR